MRCDMLHMIKSKMTHFHSYLIQRRVGRLVLLFILLLAMVGYLNEQGRWVPVLSRSDDGSGHDISFFSVQRSQLLAKDKEVNIYQRRNEHARKACLDSDRRVVDKLPKQYPYWHVSNQKMMFCPVAKGGSTFMNNVFGVIRRKDPRFVSPFSGLNKDSHPKSMNIPLNYINTDKADTYSAFLNSSYTFVFARDPYHRVYSAYLDKVLAPNSYFRGWGKMAIKQFRQSAEIETNCGADVTFAEFVKYITRKNDLILRDQHVIPVAYTCDPCKVRFDVIGKMETFETDLRHILQHVGSYGAHIVFHDFRMESTIDKIEGEIKKVFGLMYPLTEARSNYSYSREYIKLALAAFIRSFPEAKHQKHEAYLQAYSTLSRQDLEQLRDKYLPDFQMFDYDSRPAELFNGISLNNPEVDYFDIMTLRIK